MECIEKLGSLPTSVLDLFGFKLVGFKLGSLSIEICTPVLFKKKTFSNEICSTCNIRFYGESVKDAVSHFLVDLDCMVIKD